MSDLAVVNFRWVPLAEVDLLRWRPNERPVLGSSYRIYEAKDADGHIAQGQQPLREIQAPQWQASIEALPAWHDKYLTVRYFDGHIENENCFPSTVRIPSASSACRLGSNGIPAWLQRLDSKQQSVIIASDYYRNWLETTTSRCTDLARLETDNSQHLPLYWRADRRVLFHGDEEGRAPAEIFATGLTPPEPEGVLEMRAGPFLGAFESFSYSFDVTNTFDAFAVVPGIPESQKGYIYVVDAPGGLLVDKSLGNDVNIGEQEVAFPGGVRSQWIMGCFLMDNGVCTGYESNLDYRGAIPHSDAGMLRVIVSCWDPDVQISLETDGQRDESLLNSHGVGFVELGKSFTIILKGSHGESVNAQWRLNGEIIQGCRAGSLLISGPESFVGTGTILVEAGLLDANRRRIMLLNRFSNTSNLPIRADVVPPAFTVSYAIGESGVEYYLTCPAPPAGVIPTYIHVALMTSTDGDTVKTHSKFFSPSEMPSGTGAVEKLILATVDKSEDIHTTGQPYYFQHVLMHYQINVDGGTTKGYYSRVSNPVHPTAQ